MESTNIKFAQYGGANECAKTDMPLILLSEVSTGAVSLIGILLAGQFVLVFA